MNPPHSQSRYRVRFDWGLVGASAIAPDCDVAVVIDVLSFTTTLSVALDRGIEVLPYHAHDSNVATYAAQTNAQPAVRRSLARPGDISLSPRSIRDARTVPERLVLPSPNGSTISRFLARSEATTVFAASLRNADAVGRWIADEYPPTTTIAVIAAGERWPDESLRPAVEDLWGAGAVLAALGRGDACSPEAEVACGAWAAAAPGLRTRLSQCASGIELIESGYPEDVDIAAEVGSSTNVPVLQRERFVSVRERTDG